MKSAYEPSGPSGRRLSVVYSPLDWMLVHCRVTLSINSPVPIYTPGWSLRGTVRVKYLAHSIINLNLLNFKPVFHFLILSSFLLQDLWLSCLQAKMVKCKGKMDTSESIIA